MMQQRSKLGAARRGQSIVLLADQFPSNVYPWRELARQNGAEVLTVARRPDDDWTHAVLELLHGFHAGVQVRVLQHGSCLHGLGCASPALRRISRAGCCG